MPLFHVSREGLVPFRRLAAESATPEAAAVALAKVIWRDVDAVTGERLLCIYNGATGESQLPGALARGGARIGRAIVALDLVGNVVVIEVRHTLTLDALVESLNCAGWARTVTISELAELHWQGREQFWSQWQRFAGTAAPPSISRKPRLVMVATEIDPGCRSALDYLADNDVPVTVLRAGLFADPDGRHVLEVQPRHAGGPRDSQRSPGQENPAQGNGAPSARPDVSAPPPPPRRDPHHGPVVNHGPATIEQPPGPVNGRPEQRGAKPAPARPLDPLTDTLVRVKAANAERLTGTPAVEEGEPPQIATRPAPRTAAEADAPRRPSPAPGGGPSAAPDSVRHGPAQRGYAEDGADVRVLVNGVQPRYRASDSGELPPPDLNWE